MVSPELLELTNVLDRSSRVSVIGEEVDAVSRVGAWCLVSFMVCSVAGAALAEGELDGKWTTTVMNCYDVSGAGIVALTLTWEDGFYETSLLALTLVGTMAYQASGIAYAVDDVLVCLYREGESVRMEVLLFEDDMLTWQWATVSSNGEYVQDPVTLVSPYKRAKASEES